MILVDTSIWIDHFRMTDPILVDALCQHAVLVHSVVIGELAVGNLSHRSQTMADLRRLCGAEEATFDECLHLVESHNLFGGGLSPARLLSADNRLHGAAEMLGLAYPLKN